MVDAKVGMRATSNVFRPDDGGGWCSSSRSICSAFGVCTQGRRDSSRSLSQNLGAAARSGGRVGVEVEGSDLGEGGG